MELPKEKAARERKTTREHADLSNLDAGSSRHKNKKFNLNTYKFHAMADYVRSIQHFGTTNSFTTLIVCESLSYFLNLFDFGLGRVGA